METILFVTPFRRRARRVERRLQAALDARWRGDAGLRENELLHEYEVPEWAHGVAYRRAGPLSHAVVATEHRGH